MSIHKEEIFARYARHINRGRIEVWRQAGLDIVEERREGACIWDADGRRYIDCFTGAGIFNVGRRCGEIRRALVKAVEELDLGDFMFVSGPKAALAAKLAEITPGNLSCVMYGTGGGEANDYAIKLARAATGKPEIVVMEKGYHGHTGFSLAAIGREAYQAPFGPMAPGFVRVPFNDLEAVKSALTERTAAIMLEPVQGEGGIHPATEAFLTGLRRLCDEKGILLILDEIQTGWGRTGKLFCCEHYGVAPDIMTVAKSMGGGYYPISATIFTEKLNDFNVHNPFIHLSTFGGSDIGCRVAMAVIDYIMTHRLWEHAAVMGDRLGSGLETLQGDFPRLIQEVRRKGLMIGVQYATNHMGPRHMGPRMTVELGREGVIAIFTGNDPSVMRLMPSLVITAEEVDEVISAFRNAMNRIAQDQ